MDNGIYFLKDYGKINFNIKKVMKEKISQEINYLY